MDEVSTVDRSLLDRIVFPQHMGAPGALVLVSSAITNTGGVRNHFTDMLLKFREAKFRTRRDEIAYRKKVREASTLRARLAVPLPVKDSDDVVDLLLLEFTCFFCKHIGGEMLELCPHLRKDVPDWKDPERDRFIKPLFSEHGYRQENLNYLGDERTPVFDENLLDDLFIRRAPCDMVARHDQNPVRHLIFFLDPNGGSVRGEASESAIAVLAPAGECTFIFAGLFSRNTRGPDGLQAFVFDALVALEKTGLYQQASILMCIENNTAYAVTCMTQAVNAYVSSTPAPNETRRRFYNLTDNSGGLGLRTTPQNKPRYADCMRTVLQTCTFAEPLACLPNSASADAARRFSSNLENGLVSKADGRACYTNEHVRNTLYSFWDELTRLEGYTTARGHYAFDGKGAGLNDDKALAGLMCSFVAINLPNPTIFELMQQSAFTQSYRVEAGLPQMSIYRALS